MKNKQRMEPGQSPLYPAAPLDVSMQLRPTTLPVIKAWKSAKQ